MKKTKRKPTRKAPAKKKVVHRKSTALALVKKPAVVEAQLVPSDTGRTYSSDLVRLDAFGYMELKATPAEEIVLAREPAPIDISIKPTGEAYISHPIYTKWMNEAFGRGAWSLVQVGPQTLKENTVTVPYVLFVHGRPVAGAHGEQEYHPTNRNQSYGDALEACYASGLRRTTKHLGIGWQLWDRRFTNAWRREHCVQVTVKTRKKVGDEWKDAEATQWRRKDDEPLKGEIAVGRAKREPPPVEEHKDVDTAISKEKRERFWRIARRVGRNEVDIKAWLKTRYGVEKTELITNRYYDRIVRELESSDALPMTPAARQPGEEG